METDALLAQAIARTHELLRQAGMEFGIPIPFAGVRFDLSGRAAGMAVFPVDGDPFIRYNAHLLKANAAAFLDQTLPHEVAHLVAHRLYGPSIRSHGKEWQAMMGFFGAEPVRCHHYATNAAPARRLKRFAYTCSCRRHQLTSIRHHRILNGQNYFCRLCGASLSCAD